jgi:hypothetical protein
MIIKPSLFILGAGASAPYGFPIGSALVDELIQMAYNSISLRENEEIRIVLDPISNTREIKKFCVALRGSCTSPLNSWTKS